MFVFFIGSYYCCLFWLLGVFDFIVLYLFACCCFVGLHVCLSCLLLRCLLVLTALAYLVFELFVGSCLFCLFVLFTFLFYFKLCYVV